ncbi:MAG: Gfo/Idh/MocA family oxidoreductase [Verrucomicrobia bacterium]|nr:Gfo/Idh/MocA family oxidoreductase [Verrucomicrobiota bacterium]
MTNDRRHFIAGTALAAGSVFAGPSKSPSQGWRPKTSHSVKGANDDIRMACIGMGRQGGGTRKIFSEMPGVRVVALCDPDEAQLAKHVQNFNPDYKYETYTDVRRVIDNPDIDAISVTTCNHWHSLIAIWACQAGKDVYVEKPVSQTLWEGRQLVKAKEKYNRIVQSGTQNRSDVGLQSMFQWLEEGHIGKVKAVRGLCYRNRTSIGKQSQPLVPPSTCDYNLWLGPAQDEPLYRPQFHYDWHWDYNTGNGSIGNQGPHETDLIRWALGDHGMPSKVMSFGGRFGWNDAGNTPNMMVTAFDYNDIPVFFEVRQLRLKPDVNAVGSYRGTRVGIIIDCEGGSFRGGRGGGWVYDKDGKKMKQFKGDGGGGHRANFIAAVRSRKESDLNCPVEKGHYGASMGHLANISYRVGKEVSPGELRAQVAGNEELLDAYERYASHLSDWNIDFKKTPWTLGSSLEYNQSTERFTGALADKANKYLHRQDRAPFIVPENI